MAIRPSLPGSRSCGSLPNRNEHRNLSLRRSRRARIGLHNGSHSAGQPVPDLHPRIGATRAGDPRLPLSIHSFDPADVGCFLCQVRRAPRSVWTGSRAGGVRFATWGLESLSPAPVASETLPQPVDDESRDNRTRGPSTASGDGSANASGERQAVRSFGRGAQPGQWRHDQARQPGHRPAAGRPRCRATGPRRPAAPRAQGSFRITLAAAGEPE